MKVAGLISSLKFNCTEPKPDADIDRAVGSGGDDVGPVGVGDGRGRVDDAAGGHLARESGSGVVVSRTASMTWLIDQVGWAASTSATVPVTRGAAIDVPLS